LCIDGPVDKYRQTTTSSVHPYLPLLNHPRKKFRIEVTSAIEYKNFPIEEISAQVNTKMAAAQKKFQDILGQQRKISTNIVKL